MTLTEASWSQARAAARGAASVLPSEDVDVHALDGRVLAERVTAACDLPNFDSSAMDGWAVSGAGPWRQVGDARAGVPHVGSLSDGEAVRIATGAVVPAGVTAILRWEVAEVDGDTVRGVVTAGADIRPAGEEVRTGDVIAAAGTRISPAMAGFLAATGHDRVAVARQPRVHLLLLGDELLSRGTPSAGRVRDSLGPQLPGWLHRMGAVVSQSEQVVDDLSAVRDAFATAADDADVIITTGGTAAGPRDHVHAALAQLNGELIVDRVAVRPGHPMLLGQLGTVPLIGLPGNPHSAIVGLMTLGEPIIKAMLGETFQDLPCVRSRDDLRTTPDHTRLVAGILQDGEFVLSGYAGSAMLRGLANSAGFAVVEHDVLAGSDVPWLQLP
jgi:molybdopterin molybdotransferase